MQRPLRIAKTLISTYYAYMVEYRAELMLWLLSGSLPIILMGAWMQAATTGKFSLTSLQMVQYFFTVAVTRQFTVVWVIWDFEREIVEGKLSLKLLQPLDPGWHHFTNHIGERFARLPFILLFVVVFFLFYPSAFWIPSFSQFLTYAVVVASAFTLQFVLQYTLAMFAFWTEKASSLQELSFLMYLFLSGVVAPIAVFPESAQKFVQWLPYPYLVDLPANVLTGLPTDVPHGLLMIYGWIAVLTVMNRWLWRKGLRQYSGMGA
jgi:ABC-2 type transport system permease protein